MQGPRNARPPVATLNRIEKRDRSMSRLARILPIKYTGGEMNSILKSSLALTSLVAAFYFSISYQYGDPGWQLEFQPRQAEAKAETPSYDLTQVVILNQTLMRLNQHYVDQDRISQRRMIGAAMEEAQRTVAELLVDVERDADKLPTRITVRVDQAEAVFDVRDVDNQFKLGFKLKDIFRFVQENLRQRDKLREIEYAAINGMLSTLDPHSVLLRPADYREMKLSTRGKFGGLGIVISVRDGHLVIVNPIDDTPASRAELKAGDRIVQIGLDSTVNMALSDAVNLLRGEPNTTVDIWVMRDAWKKARKFSLTRADIKVNSVQSRLLAGRVGLVRIRNFQNTTIDELKAALRSLRKKARGRIKGVILDMRGNPGGLLDQAIKVSDLFIDSGPIVTTVGADVNEPKMATRIDTEPRYPLIVLTNESSASASEIVAGALKNHHRALIVGQQTFGKGSVQVIYDNKDDSALKLTIAQYLTPGDISIQSVGITPDILTRAVVLTDGETEFFRADTFKSGERELKSHLEHASAQKSMDQKPVHVVRFLEDQKLRKEVEENPNEQLVDFDVELARELVRASGSGSRDEMLEETREVLKRRIAAEDERIALALSERGIEWRPPESTRGTPVAQTVVSTDQPGDRVTAGETMMLEGTVTNTGDGPFVRLRAITRSGNETLQGHELLFGTVLPGESRTWKVEVKVPRSALTRRDAVKLEFAEANGHTPPTTELKVAIEQLPRPRFALTWRMDDSKRGNADGLLQVGEEAELVVDVENVGDGPGYALLSALRNETGTERDIFITRGRVAGEKGLARGERTTVRFSFKVKPETGPGHVPMVLSVTDSEIHEGTSEKIALPVHPANVPVANTRVRIEPRHGDVLFLRGVPEMSAPPVSTAAGFAHADGKSGEWYRISTDLGYAWVPAVEVDAGGDEGTTEPTHVEPAVLEGPPVIELADHVLDAETSADAFTLNGEVTGEQQVRDVLIYVNNKKVYFKSNAAAAAERMRFSARVPLEKGVNRISVIARQDDEASSRRTVFVHRGE